jgi:hypothetical protein
VSKGRSRQRPHTYLVIWQLAIDLKFSHLKDHGLCAIDEVLVYGPSVAKTLVCGETAHVDDLHLLDYSRLP